MPSYSLGCHDPSCEHYLLFPEVAQPEDIAQVAPAVDSGSCVGPTMARFDLAHNVCVAYDRRACEEADSRLGAAPVTGCGPVWIPEATSCLTLKALVNSKIDRWPVDAGCR